MNRGNKYSRGRGRQSWRAVTSDSSPDRHIPNPADTGSRRAVSSASGGNSRSSWQAVRPQSGGSVSHDKTSTGRYGCGPSEAPSSELVSSTFGGRSFSSREELKQSSGGHVSVNVTPTCSSTSDAMLHCSGQVVGYSVDCVKQTVSRAQSGGNGWSAFGSGSKSLGDSMRESGGSSKEFSTSASYHGKELGLQTSRLSTGVKDVYKPVGDSVQGWSSPVNLNRSFMETIDHHSGVAQLSDKAVIGINGSEAKVLENTSNSDDNNDSGRPIVGFDICPPRKVDVVIMKPSLLAMNREKRKEKERSIGGAGMNGVVLRSGMVLLKNYLSSSEQVNILKTCRRYSGDSAGFDQPGKMHLKLMCFGVFWNPETGDYANVRPSDGAKAPAVPQEFLQLVDRAIKDSQSLISENTGIKNVEAILPPVKPDICLVNYYSKTGHLGLHQDKDEGPFSAGRKIPIVSFSIGDSAEFLYSDQRDEEKADKVILKSGDVLIFGGKSRHIFHGVRAIRPDTAPKWLLNETNFRPGRLNLTFRQHL